MKKPATKQHPADVADRAVVEAAKEFTAFLRLSPKQKVVERANSLAAAVEKADLIRSAHPGREVLVYAVSETGTTHLVPKDMQDATRPPETSAQETQPEPETDAGAIPAFLKRDYPAAAAEGPEQPKDAPAENSKPARTKGKKAAAAKKPAAKKAPQEKAKSAPAPAAPSGKRAAAEEAARRGEMPAEPDFSAPTHARFRKKLAEVIEIAKAGNVEGLRAYQVNPISSSPKAIARYRDLVVIAIEAQQDTAKAA